MSLLFVKVACLALSVTTSWSMSSSCNPRHGECQTDGNDEVALLQQFGAINKGVQRHSKTESERGDKNAADLIIVGIGDSGTRGVKDLYEFLGMRFSPLQDEESGDNLASVPNDEFTPPLLTEADGRISPDGYHKDPVLWNEAKSVVRLSIFFTFAGIVVNSSDLTMKSSISWGLKNPGQYYLLPAYDEIYGNKTKYLFVSRDPRDLCTHEPNGKHNATLKMLEWFGQYQAGTKNGTDCYGMWASSMKDVFDLYENDPRFRILRIEDVVMPDPEVDASSLDKMYQLADFVGLPRPDPAKAVDFLKNMHSHNASYMGNHWYDPLFDAGGDLYKHMKDDPMEFELMSKLGYNEKHYGLETPTSPAVFKQVETLSSHM